MFTIIGKERKIGNYEGIDYDNTVLHCAYEKKDTQGLAVVAVKVKTKNLGKEYENVALDEHVSFLYDRFGNVAHVDYL